jgi:hypothetical protein
MIDWLEGKGLTGVAAVLFLVTMIALVILPNVVTGVAFTISAILLVFSFLGGHSGSLKVKFR